MNDQPDVLIIGAGLSGIGMGAQLTMDCPGTTFEIVEGRGDIGGTWDLFRYPGVRSDSDMFTFGFRFKPWLGEKTLADGDSIRAYINETADEYGIRDHIRFHSKAIAAEWSSADSRWSVTIENALTGEREIVRPRFVHSAAGYYKYAAGYTPEFPGIDDFAGDVIHPQHWPEGFDYTGKRVVVIGSGATAVTIVPAMTDKAEHVTMLQRTPTYILTLPSVDKIASFFRKILPEKLAYRVVRWKNVGQFMGSFYLSRFAPNFVNKVIRKLAAKQLPEGFDVDKHFNPPYNPWDQRLCVVPDGDFFRAIRRGKVSVATDHIARFVSDGIELESGEKLDADVVVSATGLDLIDSFAGIDVAIDGVPVELDKTYAYKGVALSGVPNFTYTVGYTNASWTLKADLVSEYLCRMINHMDAKGFTRFEPVAPAKFKNELPFIDLQSGYVTRKIEALPKQGDAVPWRVYQNYPRDARLFRRGELEDGAMQFSAVSASEQEVSAAAAPAG